MDSSILIVDDRDENLIAQKKVLEHHGFQVDTANTGKECLKKALRYNYHLIALDINMPGMGGFEVAEALSQYSRTENIPILFLSAFKITKEQLLRCLDRCAWDYIEKPIDVDIMVRKIRNNIKLYQQANELKATKQALLDEIEKKRLAEERKEDFISVVCHELKTPLTSVKGYIQLAMLSCAECGKDSKILKTADEQVVKLTRLISDLLLSTRSNLDRLQYSYEIFPVGDFMERCIEVSGHSYPGRNITLSGDMNRFLFGDKVRLEQVLLNLLSNAIKYSPAVSGVEIYVDYPEDNKLRVRVKDYGMGIPQKDQDRIFDKFFRVNGSTANMVPGLGLGLFISAEIVRHHEGTLGFKSIENEGTEFYFTLPLYNK